MRLIGDQRDKIRETVRALFGPGARVRLFGSRVDDAARGGDIDLLVEIDHAVDNAALIAARLGAQLQQVLGERRIDIVISAPNITDHSPSIASHAKQELRCDRTAGSSGAAAISLRGGHPRSRLPPADRREAVRTTIWLGRSDQLADESGSGRTR